MPDWIWMIGFIAAWLLLTRWLLPKLGVPTWRTTGCAGSRRDNEQGLSQKNSDSAASHH